MKIGDKVRVIGVPDLSGIPDDEMKTRELFEECVGRIFTIRDFSGGKDGVPDLIELHVGEVRHKEPVLETIWIEPEFVEKVDHA